MECAMPKPIINKQEIIDILKTSKTIAVVGLSPDESKDSYRVAQYLQNCGYKIVPIYPKEEMILGEKVYRSLNDIDFHIDIINVFRKKDALLEVVQEAIKLKPKMIWAQIGCYDEQAEALAQNAGVAIITNHCIMVEHKRLTQ